MCVCVCVGCVFVRIFCSVCESYKFNTHIYHPHIHTHTHHTNIRTHTHTHTHTGMIIAISFAGSIGLTAVAFVMDRKDGTLDRTWAAGVYVCVCVMRVRV